MADSGQASDADLRDPTGDTAASGAELPTRGSSELRPEFRAQLDRIQIGISRLSAGVGELIPRATEILLDGDLEGADYVILGDVEYDRKAAELEDDCFQAFALQAPVATDLRSVVAAIKIIADVERSADLCVNICKATRRLHGHPLDARLRGIIQKMGDQAYLMFKQATEAYLNVDGPAAAALRDMDSYLDELHRQFIQSIFESHAADSMELQPAVQLAVIARFYERIGDHAVLVGDRTRFIASGWVPDRPYPESGNDLSPAPENPED